MAVFFTKFCEADRCLTVEFRLNGFEQLQALLRDAGNCLALIVAAALPANQASRLKAVHQAGHVGGALDHALGDSTACMTFGVNTTKNAEDVVLLSS